MRTFGSIPHFWLKIDSPRRVEGSPSSCAKGDQDNNASLRLRLNCLRVARRALRILAQQVDSQARQASKSPLLSTRQLPG